MDGFGRLFIVLGAVLILVGLAITFGGRFNLGRLPGDIIIQRENFTFYFPLMTGIVLSVVLSAIFWFLNRFFL
ncbi:DUF2905 domain-containing protein [Dethiobacter alkaliphilus]|uniref:DUF2905 domain-containing protein n=1 Tax=Dethiobacter alkaliphilus AHT 1 TaxID=555088 RepID=C0GKF0_DETAL|nr:DUF2905 domain-containing protein [Dethiobacter alkaliphilus]EEG76193.1 conserved hypothetical protein [Dethiobacter alkaliphilus AHT 1]MCW3490798.1 DUF2905 domain-containing protein [Dethiobacter alkaliphilus]